MGRWSASAVASLLAVVAVMVAVGVDARAQNAAASPPTASRIAPAAIEAPSFQAYVDGVVAAQMRTLGVPGMVVAVATPETSYIRGYGVGSRNGEPVSLEGDRQLVPIASVSKPFIALAVMRAVEQGKIDLDAPASRYLDFPIPRFPGAREITVRDLAAHEAGFEERWVSTGASREGDPRPWGRILAESAPNVIAPPGTYQSYSNYGSSLLAYVVERAMGRPYFQVLQAEVLDPLGMTSTTIEAPDRSVLKPFEDRIVAGWKVSGGIVRPDEPFINVRTYPAGRMLSTAQDMTRLMRMVLANGALPDGRPFLTAASIETLLTPRRRVHPAMTSVGVIFAEKDINGHRFVGHGGDGGTHHVEMAISRELGVAMFVDFLSAPGPQARDFFTRSVLSALTSDAPASPPSVAAAPPDLSQFAGAYRHYRWAFTTVEKMLQLTSEFAVKDTGKGTLLVIGRLSPGEYAPVDGSGLFRHVTTGELLSLAPGYGGRMTLNQGTFPFVTAFKLQSWETQAFNALAYWVFVIGLAGLGVLGLVTAIGALRGAAAGPAVGYVGLAIALLACGVGFYVFISIAQSLSELDVQAGPPEIGKLLLGIPIAAAGIALAYVIGAVTGVSRPRSLGGWAFAVIGLAALAAFLTYLHFWNGIGWNFP